MLGKAFGVAITLFSSSVITVIFFLFLNSSANFDYNEGTISIAQAGLLYPLIVAIIGWSFGMLLFKQKIFSGVK